MKGIQTSVIRKGVARWFAAALVVVGIIIGAFAARSGRALEGSGPADPDTIFEQFRTLRALHFSAAISATFSMAFADDPDPPAAALGVPIAGTLQYWAAGDRYRIESSFDNERFPGMSMRVAYDGRVFEMALPDGTVTTSAHEKSAALPILAPNPLLELVQYRFPISDENVAREFRLKDLQAAPLGTPAFNWALDNLRGEPVERAVLPGAVHDGQAYVHHVFVQPGQRGKPIRIDRVTGDGVATTSEFTDYMTVDTVRGPTYWPRRIVIQAYNPGGESVASLTYSILQLEVDGEYGDEVFTVRQGPTDRVWDDDRSEFLQAGGN